MYWASEFTRMVIIPEHLFSGDKKFKWAYGIRTARPDSQGIIGFITKIETAATNQYSFDVALATIGTNWVSATNFTSSLAIKGAALFLPTTNVFVRGKETRILRSLITGRQVNILGYGVKPDSAFVAASKIKENVGRVMTVKDECPFVVIEMKSKAGYSGSAFFDEHKRLFILHGGMENESDFLKKACDYAERIYRRRIDGVALLTGPILLE